MAFIIRADASATIGTGHVRRMLAIAVELRALGERVVFATRPLEGIGVSAIEREGFAVRELRDAPAFDPAALLALARDERCARAIVDHYEASAAGLGALQSGGLEVGIIDDFGLREPAGVHWVLDYGVEAERRAVDLPPGVQGFLGPRYAPLRRAFASARRDRARETNSNGRRILVTLGGGDAGAELTALLAALCALEAPSEIEVLADERFTGEAAAVAAACSPHSVHLRRPTSAIEERMTWADLALCAGGTTVWELCCMGVPMIVVQLAANQARNAVSLAGAGCAIDVGAWQGSASAHAAAAAADALLADPVRRGAMSCAGRQLVDGRGAARFAAALCARFSVA